MTKAELRKKALAQRNNLSAPDYRKACDRLLAGFRTLNFEKVNCVHFFLPISERKEPDTFLLIDWLKTVYPHIQVAVSKADFSNHTMTTHPYEGRDKLVVNAYGIPEPATDLVLNLEPDLIIVPLLAFDMEGHRLGYGKGFYDRFLHDKKAQKVGLSFFGPVSEIIDVHLNDVKLDRCITPKAVFAFFNNQDSRKLNA